MNKLIFYNISTKQKITLMVSKKDQLELILKLKNNNWILESCVGKCSICNKKLFNDNDFFVDGKTEEIYCENCVYEN